MSDSQQKPWSNNRNAPVIPYDLYFYEKAWFAGNFVTPILYGMVIVLFFRCMVALFDPDYRRGERIRWGLVSYTMAMFLLVTIGTATQLNAQSIAYIDDRQFHGAGGVLSPGPIGYLTLIASKPISVIQNVAFALNNWLADGFLLHRCYIVYSMNLWVIVSPCLLYLGSLAVGIVFVYQNAQILGGAAAWSALPYFSISLSLNILITLMIVVRFILLARNTRTALGITGIGGLCKAVVMMLVESCTLYAVNSVLVIGPLGARNTTWSLFMAAISETQVIAPLLIILRVANKSALTSNSIASGHISGFKARSRRDLTDGGGALPRGDQVNSANEHVVNSGELVVGVATAYTDPHQDKT